MRRDKKSPVTSDNKKRYIKRVLRTVFLWGIVLSLSMGEMREYRSVSSFLLTFDMIRKTSLDPCPHPAQSFIAQESPKVKERTTREISESKEKKKIQKAPGHDIVLHPSTCVSEGCSFWVVVNPVVYIPPLWREKIIPWVGWWGW